MEYGQTVSLGESAYVHLRHDIMTGKLAPGVIISERELADRYSMSKTPVREAVGQVCREGLVQRLQGRGYRISPITIKEIVDLFEMRLMLESAAVEKVVGTPEIPPLLERLRAKSGVKYDLNNEESHVEFLQANREFHLAIAKATGNTRLVQTLSVMFGEMERLFHLGLNLRDSSDEMAKEHQALVAALEDANTETAKALVKEQIDASRNRIMEAIMRGSLDSVQATK